MPQLLLRRLMSAAPEPQLLQLLLQLLPPMQPAVWWWLSAVVVAEEAPELLRELGPTQRRQGSMLPPKQGLCLQRLQLLRQDPGTAAAG